MNQPLQNVLYLVIIAIVVSLFYGFYPEPNYTPHGLFLPNTTQTYPPVPENEVTFSDYNMAPSNGTLIGSVNAIYHFKSNTQQALNQDVNITKNYVEKLAAENGANYIEPIIIGRSGQEGPLDGIVIQTNVYKTK